MNQIPESGPPRSSKNPPRNKYGKDVGARLRTIRLQQGMTLLELEARSEGRWKAVVVGSYERGDRAISANKLMALAEFYGVPAAALISDFGAMAGIPSKSSGVVRTLVDLPALRICPSEITGTMKRLVGALERARNDWNGQVLSLRRTDLTLLAMLADYPPSAYAQRCVELGVLHIR
ncbi:MAG TPA: helix-turn-helix transcriptional regulator [Candidatus Nanopelagicaceae bacterium]|nr:helix-turn-helix transcriptional regulator [Candidatus Nanopelagicaceae bacterium]